ncbi:MAG: preprotein translocase subunit SecE [bacterium]|jgi:preprotein translocase subunit SecE
MADAKGFVQNVGQWPTRVKNYVQELQNEMKRVTWPSRKQVQSTTIIVIVTVFAFAAYFAVIDTVFSRIIGRLFQMFTTQ